MFPLVKIFKVAALSALITIPTLGHAESTTISDNLPLDVQVDLLMTELSRLLRVDDNHGIINMIPKIRALDIEIPDSLYFLEARALFRTGDALSARDRLIVYLANTGRDGRYYDQATELLLSVKAEAEIQEQQRQEQERKRRIELAKSAQKAQMLKIRNAQRYLQQLGFRLATETGEFNNPTREALAVYQVRHGLDINGDITNETLESLLNGVPDEHNCDGLARYPRTPQQWGIPLSHIPPQAAVAVCNDALRKYPEVIRFQIQYARALRSSGRFSDARGAIDQAAKSGYPAAEVLIARMHESGVLAEKGKPDFETALRWYQRANEKDYPQAQVKIGEYLEAGQGGLNRSIEGAVSWYRRAADQGNPPAQLIMAEHYISGRGVKRDYAAAHRWLHLAAELEYPAAEYKLGELYERGRGVKRNKTSAVAWYRKASSHGSAAATAKLKQYGL